MNFKRFLVGAGLFITALASVFLILLPGSTWLVAIPGVLQGALVMLWFHLRGEQTPFFRQWVLYALFIMGTTLLAGRLMERMML